MQPAAAPPASAAGAPTTFLRLEFASDREMQRILHVQRAVGIAAWAFLVWMLVSQSRDGEDSLMRSNTVEIVNLCVGCVCLVPLLAVGAWFAARWAAAARCPTTVRWGRQRRYLLWMTGADIALQLLNLAMYLAANIYSLVRPCAWFGVAMDVFFFLSMTTVNTLFFLSLSRPLCIFPEGTLHRMQQRWAASGWLGRCAAAAACCYCGDSGTGAAAPSRSSGKGSCSGGKPGSGVAAALTPPPVADVEEGKEEGSMAESEDWEPASPGHRRAVRRAHVLLFCLLWLPVEVLIACVTAGSLGAFATGEDTLYVCTDASCTEKVSWYEARQILDWDKCQDWHWDCSLHAYSVGLAAGIGSLFLVYGAAFLLLMFAVLMEYRRLAYAPHRVMNVVARLLLRTRGYASFFFVIAVATVFFLNINSCNANLQLALGLTPVYLCWTILDITEAFLYCPSEPKDCALKLHSLLQQFAWTEAEAPALLAERGLPDEPLFCFETALKLSYYCLHIYRHFNPESTISSMETAMALYNCDHYEWIREPRHDMNCLLCWGRDTLVVTFRGTQSLANVKADAQFWRSPHPPQRGRLWLGTRPMIHSGFLASWNGEGLDQQVLLRVRQILAGQQHAYRAGSSSGGKDGSSASGAGGTGPGGDDDGDSSGSGMASFDTTVVRCCSTTHEQKIAELAAAAAAARAAEGVDESGYEGRADSTIDEEALEAAASQLLSMSPGLKGASGVGAHNSGLHSTSSTASSAARPFRIFVTGHSLGGAVGTLCAIDIANELPRWGYAVAPGPFSPADVATPAPAGSGSGSRSGVGGSGSDSGDGGGGGGGRPVSVSCYTLGAPRTGNSAFARELVERVPDSWAVINDQDLVAKAGKFLFLFKRCGHVALINPQGDLIVNPSFLELNVQRSSYRASVAQHLLLSYNKSFAAILRGQHEGKGISGGVEATALLASNQAVRELLVRPLAIRMASLRRYIHSSLPSVGPVPHPFGCTAGVAGAPADMAAAAGAKGTDLSGMGDGADGAPVAPDAEDRPPNRLQRLASTVREMAQGTLL